MVPGRTHGRIPRWRFLPSANRTNAPSCAGPGYRVGDGERVAGGAAIRLLPTFALGGICQIMDWPGAELGNAPVPSPEISTRVDRRLANAVGALVTLLVPRPLPPEHFCWTVHPGRPWAGGCHPMLLPASKSP